MGAPRRRREASLYLRPFMYRLRGVPRGAAGRRGDLLRDRLPGRRLLHRRHQAGDALALAATTPGPAQGGTGAAKCGGNYASSLAGQLEGIENGCDQAVFLDSSTHTYVEELGGMNLFFVTKDNRLVTPELTGSILEGVTRVSVLELAKELGLEPEERRDPDPGVEGRRGQRRHRRDLRLRHRRGHHARRRAALGRRLAATTGAASTTAR